MAFPPCVFLSRGAGVAHKIANAPNKPATIADRRTPQKVADDDVSLYSAKWLAPAAIAVREKVRMLNAKLAKETRERALKETKGDPELSDSPRSPALF